MYGSDFRFEDRRTALQSAGVLGDFLDVAGVGSELGYDRIEQRTIVVLGDRVLVREAASISEQGFSSSSVSAARQGDGGVNVFFDPDQLDEAYAVARELYDELQTTESDADQSG